MNTTNSPGIEELLKAIPQLVDLIKGSSEAAGQLATLENRLKTSSVSASDFLIKLRQEAKGTRTDIDLLRTALDFNQAGASLEQIPKLVAFAGNRATVLQKPLEEITKSLINFSKETPDNLTQKLGFSEGFSKQIISQTRNLDELSKRRIFYNAILSDEFTKTDQLSAVNISAANSANKLSSAYDNFNEAKGKLLSPLQRPLTSLLNIGGGFISLLNAGLFGDKGDLDKSKDSFGQAVLGGIGFTDALEELERQGKFFSPPTTTQSRNIQKQTGLINSQQHTPTAAQQAYAHAMSGDIGKVTVKSASDIANQISVAFKAPKLAMVDLTKGLKETDDQSKKTFADMIKDSSKAGMSLTTISNTGAMVGKAIAFKRSRLPRFAIAA